jgi:hypothetical protein
VGRHRSLGGRFGSVRPSVDTHLAGGLSPRVFTGRQVHPRFTARRPGLGLGEGDRERGRPVRWTRARSGGVRARRPQRGGRCRVRRGPVGRTIGGCPSPIHLFLRNEDRCGRVLSGGRPPSYGDRRRRRGHLGREDRQACPDVRGAQGVGRLHRRRKPPWRRHVRSVLAGWSLGPGGVLRRGATLDGG